MNLANRLVCLVLLTTCASAALVGCVQSSTVTDLDAALADSSAYTITDQDREKCASAEIQDRIQAARTSPIEGPDNAVLATPEEVAEIGDPSGASDQLAKWNALAADERLFQLCLRETQE